MAHRIVGQTSQRLVGTTDVRYQKVAGDNIVAVKVKNSFGEGGLNPNVVMVHVIGEVAVPLGRAGFLTVGPKSSCNPRWTSASSG